MKNIADFWDTLYLPRRRDNGYGFCIFLNWTREVEFQSWFLLLTLEICFDSFFPKGLRLLFKGKNSHMSIFGETRIGNKNRSFSRRFASFWKKQMHIDQLLQINKMKIKIIIFHGNFQLLEKRCTLRSSFWNRPEWKSKSTVLAKFGLKKLIFWRKKIDVFAAFLTKIKNNNNNNNKKKKNNTHMSSNNLCKTKSKIWLIFKMNTKYFIIILNCTFFPNFFFIKYLSNFYKLFDNLIQIA